MQTLRPTLVAALAALLLLAPAAFAGGPQPRIINGTEVDDGDYPWQVALVTPGGSSAFCGGSLIAPNVVLTAAHCTIGARPNQIEVVAGEFDLTDIQAGERFAVTRISLHPAADVDDEDFVPRYDLSLLTLGGDATTAGGQVIDLGLDDAALLATSELFVSGWGATEDSDGDTVDVMRVASVDRKDDDFCEDPGIFGGLFFRSDQVCAVGEEPVPALVRDACQGDSGGPLVDADVAIPNVESAADWSLMGVTSWGEGCATTLGDGTILPGVYARVPAAGLRAYAQAATDGTDDAGAQPFRTGGGVTIDSDPDAETGFIACDTISASFGGSDPDVFDFLIRRVEGFGDLTVSTDGFYEFNAADAGETFFCEVRARRGGVGGYAILRSVGVEVGDVTPDPPQLVPVPVPVPGPTVTVPGAPVPFPVPFPVPDARDSDETDPRVRSVRRSCTRRRVCTFTIRATDAGTGVRKLSVTLNTLTTRPCRRNRRRTTCAVWRQTNLRATKVEDEDDTFRVRTRRLRRGTYALQARAIDRAGNIQERARRVNFTLR